MCLFDMATKQVDPYAKVLASSVLDILNSDHSDVVAIIISSYCLTQNGGRGKLW